MNNLVLITGISGWIAQHCAAELLKQGYHVRGSLRDKSREAEVKTALTPFLTNDSQLSFCELDLLYDSGWDQAMENCHYVLHVASPFVMAEPKDTNDLIKPAKEGTLRALKFAQQAGVKRVVLTSSIAAMSAHMTHGRFSNESWTDLNSKLPNSYQRSKTIAEQAAWDFYHNQDGDHKIELAVINPGAVLGPTLSPNLTGASLSFCAAMLTGKMPGIPNVKFVMADVRDVAMHHVKAMTTPEANGKRFISAHANPESFFNIAHILSQNGYHNVPTKKIPSFIIKLMSFFDREARGMVGFLDTAISCDNSQTIAMFDWKPIPLEKTVIDMGKTVFSFLKQS